MTEPTNTHTSPSLRKQLAGAFGGAAIALVLYYGYTWSSPVLGSLLIKEQVPTVAQEEAPQEITVEEVTLVAQAAPTEAALSAEEAAVRTDIRRSEREIANETATQNPVAAPVQAQPAQETVMPVAEESEAETMQASVMEETTHSGAPRLPQSGAPLVLGAIAAAGAAGYLRLRKKTARA